MSKLLGKKAYDACKKQTLKQLEPLIQIIKEDSKKCKRKTKRIKIRNLKT